MNVKKRQKNGKRILSILMGLVLFFAMIPTGIGTVPAYAIGGAVKFEINSLIRVNDFYSSNNPPTFKYLDYENSSVTHEIKPSSFSYGQIMLTMQDNWYWFGNDKVMPATTGQGLVLTSYDEGTKMATFVEQNIDWSFDSSTGVLSIGGGGVLPEYAFGYDFDEGDGKNVKKIIYNF